MQRAAHQTHARHPERWPGKSMTDTPFPRNCASEIKLPRMEKRLPTAALALTQVETLLAVPNVAYLLHPKSPVGAASGTMRRPSTLGGDAAPLGLAYGVGARGLQRCRPCGPWRAGGIPAEAVFAQAQRILGR